MSDILDATVLDDLLEYIGTDAAHAVIELFIGESRELAATIGAAETPPRGCPACGPFLKEQRRSARRRRETSGPARSP